MSDVIHQSAQQRFLIETPDGECVLAYSVYEEHGEWVIDFTSTFVPPSQRGHGLAEKLVRTGLHWAREQSFIPQASCWYVAKFLR